MKQIVMFSAPWCSSCSALKPHMDLFVEKFSNEVEFVYKDVDADENNMKEAMEYGVKSLPYCILKNGDVIVSSFTGVKSEQEIEDWYNESK